MAAQGMTGAGTDADNLGLMANGAGLLSMVAEVTGRDVQQPNSATFPAWGVAVNAAAKERM